MTGTGSLPAWAAPVALSAGALVVAWAGYRARRERRHRRRRSHLRLVA